MAWRPAKSLEKLRDQLNKAHPNRSRASDGMIGDTAHAKTVSDHNPNKDGVVTAFDITHDPANGVDIDKLSDALTVSRDPRIKYLIANSQILVPSDYGWVWQPYEGDPHTSHLHVSVWGDYDNTKEWRIGNMSQQKATAREVDNVFLGILHRHVDDSGRKTYVGKPIDAIVTSLRSSAEFKALDKKLDSYNAMKKELDALKKGKSPATVLKPGKYEVK